jgi:hypothetical protein
MYGDQSFIMYNQCPRESALHLFFLCPTAVSLWFKLQQLFKMRIISPGLSVTIIIQEGYKGIRNHAPSKTSYGAQLFWRLAGISENNAILIFFYGGTIKKSRGITDSERLLINSFSTHVFITTSVAYRRGIRDLSARKCGKVLDGSLQLT